MPSVPRRDPATTQGLKPLPDVRAEGGATAETFGGGASLEKVGAELKGLNDMNIKLAIAHQEQMDTALANEIDISMNKDRNALIRDISEKFQGANAINIPDYSQENLRKMREKYTSQAPNPSVLAKINKKFAVYSGQVDNHGQTVMAAQGEAYANDSYVAASANAKENIANYFYKPELLSQEQMRLEGIRMTEFKRKGLVTFSADGKEILSPQAKQIIEKDTSDIITGTIEKMNASKQYDMAEQYYKANKGHILGKEADSYGDYIDTARNSGEQAAARAMKIEQEKNDDELSSLMYRGQLTMAEVTRREEAGLISKTMWNSYATKLGSEDYRFLRLSMGQKNALGQMDSESSLGYLHTDPDVFATIRQHQLKGDLPRSEIHKLIFDSSGKQIKGLSADDAEFLRKMNSGIKPTPFEEAYDANITAMREWSNSYVQQGKILGFIPVGPNKEQIVGALTKDFIDRVEKENPKDLARLTEIQLEVRDTYIKKRYPEVTTLKGIPHVEADIGGKVDRLMRPDEPTTLKGDAGYVITRVKKTPKPEEKPKK